MIRWRDAMARATNPSFGWAVGPDRLLREPLAGLEPEHSVGLPRDEGHDIGAQQLGDGVDDRGDDPRPVQVGHERAADRENPFDGMQPFAPLIVESGRPEGRRQRVHEHLRKRDLRRSDRMLERPLEVDDPEQLPAVDDRGRDLAPNVVARRAIVGIDEHVRDELGLLRLGGASDDADADVDDVERRRVAGDTDHRQLVASGRQVHRDEGDLEFSRDVVDDRLDDVLDRLVTHRTWRRSG